MPPEWPDAAVCQVSIVMTKCGARSIDGFVGDLVDGERHGYGVHTYPNGAKYAGEWKGDHPDGWGVIQTADGSLCVGRFEINQRHGCGVQFFANGEIDDNDRVYWAGGVLVEQSEWFARESLREFEAEIRRIGLPFCKGGGLSSEEKLHILAELSGDWILGLPGMLRLAMMATAHLNRKEFLKNEIFSQKKLSEVLAMNADQIITFFKKNNLSQGDRETLVCWVAWSKSEEREAADAHLRGRFSEVVEIIDPADLN